MLDRTLTILDDVEFRNFDDEHCQRHPHYNHPEFHCDIYHILTHSGACVLAAPRATVLYSLHLTVLWRTDVFRPQDMNLLKDITYTNVTRRRVGHV